MARRKTLGLSGEKNLTVLGVTKGLLKVSFGNYFCLSTSIIHQVVDLKYIVCIYANSVYIACICAHT